MGIHDFKEEGALLREQLQRDGFLCIRGLFPKELLVATRYDVERLCLEHGLLVRTAQGELQYNSTSQDDIDLRRKSVVLEWTRSANYRRALGYRPLRSLLGSLLREPTVPHPSPIAALGRLVPPKKYVAEMPPHQDCFYLKGPQDFVSVWIPCMDCPQELGPLAILRGSHRMGLNQRNAEGYSYDIGTDWVTHSCELGDLILFLGNTIHGPLPNLSESTMRIVMDFRFCRASDVLGLL